MSTVFKLTRLLPAAAAAAALGAMSTTALARSPAGGQGADSQTSGMQTTTVRSTRAGFARESVQLSQNVSYADLDLATAQGADELHHRIHQTATRVCDRLGMLYPEGSFAMEWQARRLCVQGAVDGAMTQAKIAIASAERQQADQR